MRSLAASLLAVSLALPLAGQEKLVESIEVRVVNVDVVVTDRSGNPVTGLTKDDFQLFENGKPQTITNIYEVRPETTTAAKPSVGGALEPAPAAAAPAPPPVEMRQRRLALFVDNSSLGVFERRKVLDALQKFIQRDMRPGDEASLVAWNPGLRIVTPFTDDRKLLLAGLKEMSTHTTTASDLQVQPELIKRRCNEYLESAKARDLTFPQALDMCIGGVSAFSEELAHNARNVLEAMRLTSTTLAGVDGKKVMVIAGAHLPERPGLDLNMWAYQLFQQYMRGLNQMRAMTETSHNLQTFSIEKFAKQANADNVTVYIIDAADARDVASAENASAVDPIEAYAKFTNTAMAYQTIASITGGVMVNSTNYDSAFNTIAKDLGYYYSLGYKPGDDAKAGDRKIVVKAKNPDYRIRSRETYQPKSSEEQINDRVIANIYHSSVKSDWPIRIVTGAPVREGDRFRIPLQIAMDSNGVTLLPQEGQMVGGFNVYLAVGTDGGAMSKVSKSPQSVKVPATAEKDLRAKPMTYDMSIVVRPGESTLSVAVVDQISNNSGFARTKIVAR